MITICGPTMNTQDLMTIPVIRPERAGARWQGVSHYALATTLENALQERGITASNVGWTTGKNDQALFGGMDLSFPVSLDMPHLDGMTYSLALRHSNDMSRSLQFFAGLKVMICSNGVATGSFILARRHTTGIDLQEVVALGVERLIAEARNAVGTVDQLKERKLRQRTVDHLLCEAGRNRLLSWGHLGLVEKEYREPEHAEFRERDAWCLYNAFNHIAKRVSPGRQLTALDRFRDLLLLN